ncbi:MAG: DUF2510 domain-containing protein [Acidimicrobiaceae bacterium]|nr:DUF2510 domain-containing protein [Acidimicrobiaceae bacterium]
MADLPPPNWYTDPTDESLYRYWDGSVWTDHCAPRYTEAREALRGPGELIRDSFALLRRQWRVCGVAVLVSAALDVISVLLLLFSVDKILMGELGEILERVSDAGFDPDSPDNRDYFESLEFGFSVWNLLPGILGLLLFWLSLNLFTATVVLTARCDLRNGDISISKVLRQAVRRVPRLFGVDLQILALCALGMGVVLVSGLVSPWLLILFVPAFLVFLIASTPVFSIVDVVASAGPSEPSLLYAFRLVQKRFWGVMGRVLLILLIFLAAVLAVSAVLGALNSLLGSFWWFQEICNALLSGFIAAPVSIAMAIVYLDLGGDWEQEP